MAELVTEWVNVTGDISIIARESGEVWFHTPSGTKENVDLFATPMTGVGSAGSTDGLLDGAISDLPESKSASRALTRRSSATS
jgi:hypothetical protein